MTLLSLGPLPYSYTPVSASANTLSFAIRDLDGTQHPAFGVDGMTVSQTMDLLMMDGDYDLAWIKRQVESKIGQLQIAEAGGISQLIAALISQGVRTVV